MRTTESEKLYEHNGILWRPKPSATATFEEMLAARAVFVEIHQDALWNPWVEDDRADDLERAEAVMGQWTRGEPWFRYKTNRQLDAEFADVDRRISAERAADEARWEHDSERYNLEREVARLSLLEMSSILARDREELAAYRSGERFPAMPHSIRAGNMAELEVTIAQREATVKRLAEQVGDPEDVVDKQGYLPRDRRVISLMYYRMNRERDVTALRAQIPELQEGLKQATDKAEKPKLRTEIQIAERRLADLLAVPPLTADDMCSECATPASKHGWVTPPYQGPCPAWPGWSARLREVRRMLEQSAARTKLKEADPRKPQPLATVPSGLPLGEVAKRLAELDAEFPGAIVKRGRANRWELWPPK
ncbi:hypothetical protein [Agromyces mariniharenae]|uniref:Uncharacterized protein n=1 Tax=Agromyces mariniharenae TaxID=2604423 RepID=A0A5S4UXV1_9MICO|nr:hypothetical protein [Agromyces mariniharenae]TYL50443.1 hypothetical protein FYC51_14645 [Agromyces mariniharenae]